jgi:hypothetical protein
MFAIVARAVALAGAALMLVALLPPPASASVTCMVRQHGRYICTFFCQDGMVCDNANRRCVPGPEALKRLSEAKEKAQKATLEHNRDRVASHRQANSQSLGHDLGSTYYIWDGDPREIPTPRHRQGGGIPASGASRYTPSTRAPVPQITVRPAVRSQLLALIAAARSFATTDSHRAGAVKLLRRFVRGNRIPIDVDELLSCDTPKIDTPAQIKTITLGWTVPDIEQEIEKRGLCVQATSDDERRACEDYQFGQVVMSVEPELKALCKLQENDPQEKDPEALGECAETKFRNAHAAHNAKISFPSSGTAVAVTAKCPAIAADNDVDDLRRRLKRALDEAGIASEDVSSDEAQPPSSKQPMVLEPKPEPAEKINDEDPFCAYIARRAVRGELTPDAGAKIPDNCRSAMDAAKSCAEQKCSMADVIEREERQNMPRPLPWGSEDYQAIEALQR